MPLTDRPLPPADADLRRRQGRAPARRGSRRFPGAFAIVAAALAALGLAGAAVTTAQGPRVTRVDVDPDAAVTASGSRIIFTTTQALDDIDPEQVTVTPSADFTVDTAGRSVGIRFTLPLWDETDYTVRIDGVTGRGGGSAATIEHSFTTPALTVYLLQRGADGDTVFRTGLAGKAAEPVFRHPHIEDFRATAGHLVFATVDDERSRLIVTDRDGANERELPLPGDGIVSGLQSADRGELIGYTFTDVDLDGESGRDSALFTASLDDQAAGDAPLMIERPGGDSRVAEWRFVPDADALLMLTFDGALTLVASPGTGGTPGDPVALGAAVSIEDIARGSTVAIVDRADGPAAIDLTTAEESPLAATDPEHGQASSVLGLADGSTLRALSRLDPSGVTVEQTSVAVVSETGDDVRTVFTLGESDALLQVCLAPSNRYAAVVVAPGIVDNPYDGYLLPLPERVETHIVDLTSARETAALRGFDVSWCRTGPRS